MAKNPGTQTNSSLDNLLNSQPAAAVVETAEPTIDEVAVAAVDPAEQSSTYACKQTGERRYRVFRTKTHDDVISATENPTEEENWEPQRKPRKYKSYQVTAVGVASKQLLGELPFTVDGCLDASEAKQVVYAKRGVEAPSKYPVKVALVK